MIDLIAISMHSAMYDGSILGNYVTKEVLFIFFDCSIEIY